jgi:hypothetical protein
MSRLYIEAVTVCAKAKGYERSYADIAAYTFPQMKRQVDRLLVVTSPDDVETKDLCHRLNIELLETDDFSRDGDAFNKGRGIERGLAMLAHDEWLLHIDADIYLPDDFRESLLDADLDPRTIYGADRVCLVGWEAFDKWRQRGTSRQFHCFQHTYGVPLGARWVEIRYGYVPIGFFQLWHESAAGRKGIRTRRYPEWHANAARADVKFALQWDRKHRQLLPEVIVGHIEPHTSAMGANWEGRTTRPFGPPSAPAGPPAKPAPQPATAPTNSLLIMPASPRQPGNPQAQGGDVPPGLCAS